MGMTIAEKILAAHAGVSSVKPGQYIWCKVDATSGHKLGDLAVSYTHLTLPTIA